MKVFVEPRVVAGTNLGGENLFLEFTASHSGDTPPVDEPVEVLFRVRDDWDGGRTTVSWESDEESDDEFLSGVVVRYRTCAYELEWEGNGVDALVSKFCSYDKEGVRHERTVESVLRDPSNWKFCHRPGEPAQLRCHYKYYVDGNAD